MPIEKNIKKRWDIFNIFFSLPKFVCFQKEVLNSHYIYRRALTLLSPHSFPVGTLNVI